MLKESSSFSSVPLKTRFDCLRTLMGNQDTLKKTRRVGLKLQFIFHNFLPWHWVHCFSKCHFSEMTLIWRLTILLGIGLQYLRRKVSFSFEVCQPKMITKYYTADKILISDSFYCLIELQATDSKCKQATGSHLSASLKQMFPSQQWSKCRTRQRRMVLNECPPSCIKDRHCSALWKKVFAPLVTSSFSSMSIAVNMKTSLTVHCDFFNSRRWTFK